MAEATEGNLAKATDLYVNDITSLTTYSYEQAMIDAGIDRWVAKSKVYQNKLKNQIDASTDGALSFPMDEESKMERFRHLYGLLCLSTKQLNLARVMERAGISTDEIYVRNKKTGNKQQSAVTARCRRIASKLKSNETVAAPDPNPAPSIVITTDQTKETNLSPLTVSTHFSFASMRIV